MKISAVYQSDENALPQDQPVQVQIQGKPDALYDLMKQIDTITDSITFKLASPENVWDGYYSWLTITLTEINKLRVIQQDSETLLITGSQSSLDHLIFYIKHVAEGAEKSPDIAFSHCHIEYFSGFEWIASDSVALIIFSYPPNG